MYFICNCWIQIIYILLFINQFELYKTFIDPTPKVQNQDFKRPGVNSKNFHMLVKEYMKNLYRV